MSAIIKYREVRNDYIDETYINKGIVKNYIDAWLTEDDNEEGRVVAIVTAEKTESENKITVTYNEEKAKKCDKVKVAIKEAIEEMKQYKF